jgi:polar amino acid transport system substrate-binding protein
MTSCSAPFRLLLLAMLAAPCGADPLQIYTDDSPPVSFMRGGVVGGWAVELVEEIQKRAGGTSQIRIVPWARAYHVAQRESNVAIFAVMRTQARDPLFQWVGPLQNLEVGLYAKAGSDITISSLDDAKRIRSIGVTRAFATDEELTRMGFQNLDRVERPEQMLHMLMSGKNRLIASDSAFISDEVLRQHHIEPGAIVRLYKVTALSTYIAFSKGTSPDLVKSWQKALDDMRADGSFARIYAKSM